MSRAGAISARDLPMPRTVLFADPDQHVLSALETMFAKDAELTIVTASTVAGALEALHSQKIDVVVAERMLEPGRSSELLDEVHQLQPATPLILLTDFEDDTAALTMECLGPSLRILRKPWDAPQLRDAVLQSADPSGNDSDTDPFVLYAGLTEKQLRRAQRVQSRMENHKSLGEVLLELGDITSDEFERVQSIKRAALSLIEILHDDGHVTDAAVEAYRDAKRANPAIDDRVLLVDAGQVSEDAYLRALAAADSVPFDTPVVAKIDHTLLNRASLPYLRRLNVLPVAEHDGRMQLATAGPLDRSVRLELEEIFKLPIDLQYSTSDHLAETLRTLERRQRSEQGSGEARKLVYGNADGPTQRGDAAGQEAVHLFDGILMRAIELGASDIHVQPSADSLRVRVRVDGRLQPLQEFPKDVAARVTSRIKVLAGADISERRLHQDGKITVTTGDGAVDIRVSSYVSVHGENLVLRLLDRNRGLVPLHKLGFTRKGKTLIADVILPSASGLVVITGPTGSGKTTTLYSLMQHNLDPEEVVISAEDPVEYVIDGIVQCNVNETVGPTFVDSLRAIVRQDPDTIIVGEMRDERTVKMAFESALTGHKVFSTFHTENAVSAIIRLLEMGVAPFLVSSTLSAIVAQRLVRRMCSSCATPTRPAREELKFLGMQRSDLEGIQMWAGRGCDRCKGSGFAGRMGIHEVLVPDDEFRDAVLRRAASKELETLARRLPQFMTLQEDGFLKATQKMTSVSELVGHVPRDLNARPLADLREIAGLKRDADPAPGSGQRPIAGRRVAAGLGSAV